MIRRTEIIGDATLHLGDALDVMLVLQSVGAQALIGDPPYCSGGFTEAAKRSAKGQGVRSEILRDFGWFAGDNMTSSGLAWLLRAIAVAFKGHAVDAGATLSFFADWRMVALLAPAIESAGLRLQAMPIWDKETAGLGTGFRAQHECVLHFSIETPTYFSKRQGNVLNAKRPPSERDHPTEKPVALMAKLVDVQSGPGGLVLDPFMGSGSTGVAAIQHGRRFVGIEHDPEHFDTACRRLERAWKSPRLFREPETQGSLLDGGEQP